MTDLVRYKRICIIDDVLGFYRTFKGFHVYCYVSACTLRRNSGAYDRFKMFRQTIGYSKSPVSNVPLLPGALLETRASKSQMFQFLLYNV
jgi:hypothetical protein